MASVLPDFHSVRPALSRISAASTPAEDRWLFNAVAQLPDDATIVLAGRPRPHVTTAMALACRGTARRIHLAGPTSEASSQTTGAYAEELRETLAENDLQDYVVAGEAIYRDGERIWSKQIDFLLIDQEPRADGGFEIYDDLADLIWGWGLVAVLGVEASQPERLQAWSRRLSTVLDRPSHFFSIAYGRQPHQFLGGRSKVHVIVPVFNRKEETRTCLLSILDQSVAGRMTVTVVDDGSTDGTEQMLETEFPSVEIIKGDGNLWWTGAVAKALDTLRSRFEPGDFFLLVNNDSILQPETVAILVRESVHNGRCGVAPLALEHECGDPLTTGFALRQHHVLLDFERQYAAIIKPNTLFEAESLYGRCSLFPVEVLDYVDNYDAEAFPQYYGDVDFCLRARKQAFRFFVTGATCIQVQHGADNTGSHFAFRQGAQTLAEVKANLFSIRSLDNVIITWRYTSRHHPHRAVTATLKTAWRSLRYWRPIYAVVGPPRPQNTATRAAPARASLAGRALNSLSRTFNVSVVRFCNASRRLQRRAAIR